MIDILRNSKVVGIPFDQEIYKLHKWEKSERNAVFNEAFSIIEKDGILCEFGVLKGKTLRLIAQQFPDRRIFGFDSFEGLPEEWKINKDLTFEKGRMFLGYLPEVPENVKLVKGWYNETIPNWKIDLKEKISFLHIDCDLYSSTKTILTELDSFIEPGCIIVFDEMYSWNDESAYSEWADGEYKALVEWIDEKQREVEIICRNNYLQCCIRITK